MHKNETRIDETLKEIYNLKLIADETFRTDRYSIQSQLLQDGRKK